MKHLISAWFGKTSSAGVCQCCQKAAPVYPGFNGGASTGEAICGHCQRPDHKHSDGAEAELARVRAELERIVAAGETAARDLAAVPADNAQALAVTHRAYVSALRSLLGGA